MKEGTILNKERLRFLALGFFCSAVILAAFQLLFPPASVEDTTTNNALVKTVETIQQENESLIQENEQLLEQIAALENEDDTHTSPIESETDIDSNDSSIGQPESIDTENETSEDVISPNAIVFLIHEGQASSTVLENLYQAGIIEDVELAETYLQNNGLMTRIQYGSYTLSPDMPLEQILQLITM